MELHLSLLGNLQISRNGRPVSGFVSSKAQALLCFLALTGRPHSRETVAALLWGDMPDTEAKANLRNALSNLRKLVGAYVQADRESVAFNRALPYRLDVEAFEAALLPIETAAVSLERLRRAVDLYRGDLLEGFVVRDALEFEEWLITERERLRQLAGRALFDLSVQLGEAGEYQPALAYTTRLLALEPWHEAGHRQMMTLLTRNGQRNAALAHYETCRRILADELGVDPSAETTALYQRLKAAATPAPHNLPWPATPFLGRTAELARLAANLAHPNCRLLTLTGPGGVGKTRLALQTAAQCLAEGLFPDGIFWIPLAEEQEAGAAGLNQPQLLASTVAATLNVTPLDPADPQRGLLEELRPKTLLLILDNLEYGPVPDGLIAWLTGLLQAAPGLKLLITSRERLNLQEEWLLEVGGLAYPRGEWTVEQLPYYSAIALFLQQARQIQPYFALTPVDAPHLVRLCQFVEGLPLALELAAGWLRVFTCADIVAEIEQGLSLFSTSLRNVPERHRSLRVMFDRSWQLLSAQEQATLRRLSVFRGGFKREAGRQVTAAGLPVLAALVDKSLLRMTAQGRYQIHELLRQYAAEKLAELPAEQTAALDQHAAYYANFLQEWQQHFERDASPEVLAELNVETANIRQGWQRAIEPGTGVEVSQYWYLGQVDQARYLVSSVSGELHPPAPEWDQGLTLHRQGLQAFYEGDYPAAQQHFTAASLLFSAVEDTVYLARAQVMLGQLAYQAGHDVEAETLLRRGVLGLKAAGDHRYRAYVLVNLAQLTGEIAQTQATLEKSLTLSRSVGAAVSTAHILKNLGRLALALGQAPQARPLFEESITLYRAAQELWGLASALVLLGQTATMVEDLPAAEPALQEALRLALPAGFKPVLLDGLIGLAEARLKLGPANAELVTWLILAGQHPASWRDSRDRAGQLLAHLEGQVSPETLAAAKEAATQTGALATAVKAILAG